MKFAVLIVLSTFWLAGCGGSSGSSGDGEQVQEREGEWLIPSSEVADGGPGKDGIPSLDTPRFVSNTTNQWAGVDPNEIVVGMVIDGVAKAYPHNVLDWHEVVNDLEGSSPLTLSYCPLTGSAIAWSSDGMDSNKSFGVSGLLYNSNLILYDRASDSYWAQMQQRAVSGERIGEDLSERQLPLIETTWAQWTTWFPDSLLMSNTTGFSRNYDLYPYGDYLDVETTLFAVDNSEDKRLFGKSRVLGVNVGTSYKAYEISQFATDWQVIYDQVGGQELIVIGSANGEFAVAFERPMLAGELMTLTPVADGKRFSLTDQEGNHWNVLGHGVSEGVMGQSLNYPTQYVAFWFAWTAFFNDTALHAF